MDEKHRTVLTAEPESETLLFDHRLAGLGYRVLHSPFQVADDPDSWVSFDRALLARESYAGVIVPNSHAASGLLKRIREKKCDIASLPPLFAVGTATAAILDSAGTTSTPISPSASPEDLDTVFGDPSGRRYLLAGTTQPARGFSDYIDARGGNLDNAPVYRLAFIAGRELQELDRKLIEGDVDCLAFFSPASPRTFAALIPEFKQATLMIAVMDQGTAAAVSGCGLRVDVIAPQRTGEAFAQAIADRFDSDTRIELDPDQHMDYA